jgi:hypothetical protein
MVPRRPGESEHDWSMRCKNYYLEWRRKRLPEREPGEDVEEAA